MTETLYVKRGRKYVVWGGMFDSDKDTMRDRKLRELLFFQHSHNGSSSCLYGDDGEMQCGVCGCDFVRDDALLLERKISDHNLREMVRLGIATVTPNVY